MRVLFDGLPFGRRASGTRTRLLGLIPPLLRRGVEVIVVHGPGLDDEERALLSGARLVEIATPPRSRFARAFRRRSLFAPIFRELAPNVVVADALPMPDHPGLVPQLHDLRHQDRRLWRAAMARTLDVVGQVHVPSATIGRAVAALFPDARAKVRVVPNGVDLARFSPDPLPEDAALLARRSLSGRYLLCVGHLEPRKDPLVLLSVVQQLIDRRLPMPLVYVGNGEVLPEEGLCVLRALYPLVDVGRVLRDVQRRELPALLRNATALLAPARLEGFGIAPLEALACGTTVIATDIPAHREVLRDAALFVPPGDPKAFTDQIVQLRYGNHDRGALRERGLLRAQELSWDRAAEAFLAALAS